jgi:hypothetical protein
MTINAQSECGEIKLFYDFCAGLDLTSIADNTTTQDEWAIGPFRVFGDGVSEVDAGVYDKGSDELSGVGVLTTTDETEHCTALGTYLNFDVGLMGTIVVEARVRLTDLDTKEIFIGLADVVGKDLCLEDDLLAAATATITPVASDYVGFYLSAELTDDEDWHAVYNGGSTTGVTASGDVDLDDDAVAGEWQVLRLEVDNNGTARWYIDGVLKKTLAGACSTTTDMGVVCGVEAKGNAQETMDVDYLLVKANRDWNA